MHGEYRFSALEMRPPAEGGRLMGHDLRVYMEAFSDKFKHVFRFDTEVVNIRRDQATSLWFVTVQGKRKSSREVLEFSHVVLCTGVSFFSPLFFH